MNYSDHDHSKRCFVDGGIYHVGSRTNSRPTIFTEKAACELFMAVLAKTLKKYTGIKLLTYCLMPNHFHLMIMAECACQVPKFMQVLKQTFAILYNRAHGRRDHCWGMRYFANYVESEREFWEVVRYVDENPVRAKLVKHFWQWPWGSGSHLCDGTEKMVTITAELHQYYHHIHPKLE